MIKRIEKYVGELVILNLLDLDNNNFCYTIKTTKEYIKQMEEAFGGKVIWLSETQEIEMFRATVLNKNWYTFNCIPKDNLEEYGKIVKREYKSWIHSSKYSHL